VGTGENRAPFSGEKPRAWRWRRPGFGRRGWGGGGNQETGLIDDELETLDTSQRVPADPSVVVLEIESGGTPEPQTDPLAVLLGHLVEAVARREAGAEEMFRREEGGNCWRSVRSVSTRTVSGPWAPGAVADRVGFIPAYGATAQANC
jgi:hypothetical protein